MQACDGWPVQDVWKRAHPVLVPVVASVDVPDEMDTDDLQPPPH